MPTVYLVCPLSSPDTDMKPVEAFGKLNIINSRFVFGDEIEKGSLPDAFKQKVVVAAENFDPAHDYLMLGGDHLQFSFMSALLGSMYGLFQVLRWDRPARGYVPVKFEIW